MNRTSVIIVGVVAAIVAVVVIITTSVVLTRSKDDGAMDECEGIKFVNRTEWGARPPKGPYTRIPPTNMTFLHHTAGNWKCNNFTKCAEDVRDVQNLHMDTNGWDDIGYNFLIGEDGRVYEGRGWQNQGAHAPTYNAISHGVCIIGNYMTVLPDPVAIQTAKALIKCGIQKYHILANYELFGHRDGRCTECPGNLLYEDLQTWDHYSQRQIPIYCPTK